ncbi:MAG: FAD-binding domain-containing protein [Curvibacter sp.]
MSYHLVWFKRDLRLHDHAALHAASKRGPVLCLYIVEFGLWQQPDAARQHYEFVRESLADLQRELQARSGHLLVLHGEATEALARLWQAAPFDSLHSHEETGNGWTYVRDQAVARWCRAHGVPWQEAPQFGVVRALRNRDHWQGAWEEFMGAPVLDTPALRFAPPPLATEPLPSYGALRLDPHDPPRRQRGGRTLGLAVLRSFLGERARHYRGGISSPLTAPSACSRLSAYLAWGCLSLREVVQATRERTAFSEDARLNAGLHAFQSRLYWHCHFIQKLESEPAIEFENMHRGYNGLREGDFNAAHFEALTNGRTGWPLVDACVAMLRETGWLNFRMRAMLVSVAAYPLWLHWRPVGVWLATQFLDYEPGIHWSQLQMQSGTTGINTTRVYNPVKQALDHDPGGRFVRKWLPTLRRVPDSWLLEPWRMPRSMQEACGVHLDREWPNPLVELEAATRIAKQRLYERRGQASVRAAKADVVQRHGSRRRPESTARKTPAAPDQQLSLDW